MKILLLTREMRPHAGGPPQVVACTAIEFAEQGHQVTIACIGNNEKELKSELLLHWPKLFSDKISILVAKPTGPRRFGYSSGLSKLIRNDIQSFDLLHIHGVWERCLHTAAKIFQSHGKPVFVSVHGLLDIFSIRQSYLIKQLYLRYLGVGKILRKSGAVIFATEEELRKSCNALQLTNGVVIANGVVQDFEKHMDGKSSGFLVESYPRILNWDRTGIYFSRIHPKKGLDLLIEAFRQINAEYCTSGLLIIGIKDDVSFEDRIRKQIADACLEDHLVLSTDIVGNGAKDCLSLADYFVLPSHQEGFSIAILEAMSLGKPVLITDKCHFPEVQISEAGFVVENTVAGIVEGLENILSLPQDSMVQMGRNASVMVLNQYSWKSITSQLLQHYSSSL